MMAGPDKKNDMMRLDRLLANLGYGARKYVTAEIKKGAFSIDGTAHKNPDEKFSISDLKTRNCEFDGCALEPLPPLTLMLHKPAGTSCSHDDAGPVIFDLMPFRFGVRTPKLSIAGRLDKDTTGLVILSDDGQLVHRIITPKTQTPKHYRLTLQNALRGDEAALFEKGGMMLEDEDKPLRPARFVQTGEREGEIVLREGRYHQIKRMFEETGNAVTKLHRYRIGGLDLGDLAEGEYRVLDEADLASIFGGDAA